jgi:hypothetical protein
MGLLDRRHERAFHQEHDEWATHVASVRVMAQTAHDWKGEPISPGAGIIGKPGELAYLVLQGAALIEPRRLPGHWSGRSQGFSIPVYKGIRYRVGSTKGTFQQGAEVPTPIDQGTVLISNLRAVFAGSKATREWLFPKLVGFHHDEQQPWTALQVSNRQKVSGFMYTEDTEIMVRFRLELALAEYSGSRAPFAASIDEQLADLLAAEPAPPASLRPTSLAPAVAEVPAGQQAPAGQQVPAGRQVPAQSHRLPPAAWYPNPNGPGQRYWDGAAWTDQSAP